MSAEQLIGWTASALLCLTLSSQVIKQIRERTCEGVSRFLFLGQLLASILFLVYSVMTRNAVFIVSNAFLVLAALIGQGVLLRNRRLRKQASGDLGAARAARSQAKLRTRGSRAQ